MKYRLVTQDDSRTAFASFEQSFSIERASKLVREGSFIGSDNEGYPNSQIYQTQKPQSQQEFLKELLKQPVVDIGPKPTATEIIDAAEFTTGPHQTVEAN
jgi:hypothetical protein